MAEYYINNILWSEQFNNWINMGVECDDAQTDYFLGTTAQASLITEKDTFSWHMIETPKMSLDPGDYTFTINAQSYNNRNLYRIVSSNPDAADFDVIVNANTGGILQGDATSLPVSAWYKTFLTFTVLSTGMFSIRIMLMTDAGEWDYQGEDGEGLLFAQAQFHPAEPPLNLPDNYIITLGAPRVEVADDQQGGPDEGGGGEEEHGE